ncbi:FAD/NAD(P)-binding protein [Brevibacterium album]|uniref:FAD/NAD(P)-binding protein n=1 Tax=Brevibacterium album TaxID=417948 RepID=UPI00041E77CD|nr:FAD/NAD(P)-binding protein [Brevibacterium album]
MSGRAQTAPPAGTAAPEADACPAAASAHEAAGAGEPQRFDAVIVGGGPRGVATVIRTVARLEAESGEGTAGSTTPGAAGRVAAGTGPLRIAMVDACEVGPGATWLTTQPAQYLNNTTASATTIHPDESTHMSGPPSPGPTLVDWMEQVFRAGHHSAGAWVPAEAGSLRALDFTSRRLQGVYYRDQLDAAAAHPRIALTEFRALAVDLETRDSGTAVVLADGRRLAAPTVVLAQGMVQAVPDSETQRLTAFASEHGLRYVPPGMPAERDFSRLPAGETVLVRGLGANFFDVIGALAAEWGGRFEEVEGDPHGRLRYVPTGREPRLVVGSRRGMPYRSKPVPYSPERPFAARWARPEWFAQMRERRGLDFAAEVWPVIAREIADQYLAALADWAPEALREDLRPAPKPAPRAGTADGAGAGTDGGASSAEAPAWVRELEACETGEEVEAVLREAVVDPRWNWVFADLRRPTRGNPVAPEEWADFVDRLVADELASMSEAAVHPRAAVNRVMSVLRGPAQQLGAVGAVAGDSLVRDLHGWFDADGLFLASGPPAGRVRQVLALIEAGIVDLLGPETAIDTVVEDEAATAGTGGGPTTDRTAVSEAAAGEAASDACESPAPRGLFRAASGITGRTAEARVLLETRMSKGKVTHTDDPLLQALLSSGRARIHTVDGVRTDYIEASGAEVSEAAEAGHNLVDASGAVDRSVVVLGIPASTTQPGSAIGATPHKSSPLLAGADIAAKQIVRRARGPVPAPVPEHPQGAAGSAV